MFNIIKKQSLLSKLIVLAVILFLAVIFSVTQGSVKIDIDITYKSLINSIFGKNLFEVYWDSSIDSIIYELRLPRIILACISGASLALAGVLMQSLTRNSLADPYILGISSGASAGATLAIVFGGFSFLGSNMTVVIGAFLGAAISSFLVFFLSDVSKSFSKTKLVLTGIAVSSIFGALTTLVVTYAKNDSLVKSAIFWVAGSLSGANYAQIKIALSIMLICMLIIIYIGRDLDLFILGENIARNMGIHIEKTVGIVFIISTILTGTIVSFIGVVGFVGLLVPHIARQFVGSSHRKVIPVSMLIGAILMVFTDTLGRTLISPQEIPLGVITALIGGPFFLFLLKQSSYNFGGK